MGFRSPSTCVKFFFLFNFTLIFVRFSRTPAFMPLSPSFAFFSWNKLGVSASAPITVLSSQIIYIYTYVLSLHVVAGSTLRLKYYSLSLSLPPSSLTPACRFVDSKGTLTTTFDRTTMGGGETYSHPFIPLPRRMLRVYPVSRVTKCTRRHPPSSARACTCRLSVL